MENLISVIIPVYCSEKWLAKCVDSVQKQTYHKLEIILVDDGSTDNCPFLCDQFAKQDSRIIVIHQKNCGLSSARNAGLDIATGDFIVFVDSDDYMHPGMIEALFTALQKEGADIALCGIYNVTENGDIIEQLPASPAGFKPATISGTEALKPLKNCTDYYWVVAWNKLYRKDLWRDLRYPAGKIHEDEFVIHHLFAKCRKVTCLSEHYYYYVRHESGITGTVSPTKRLDFFEAYLERLAFYLENDLTEVLYEHERTCFRLIRLFRKLDMTREEKQRFRSLRKEYYKMHGRTMQLIHYPFLCKIQVMLSHIK